MDSFGGTNTGNNFKWAKPTGSEWNLWFIRWRWLTLMVSKWEYSKQCISALHQRFSIRPSTQNAPSMMAWSLAHNRSGAQLGMIHFQYCVATWTIRLRQLQKRARIRRSGLALKIDLVMVVSHSKPIQPWRCLLHCRSLALMPCNPKSIHHVLSNSTTMVTATIAHILTVHLNVIVSSWPLGTDCSLSLASLNTQFHNTLRYNECTSCKGSYFGISFRQHPSLIWILQILAGYTVSDSGCPSRPIINARDVQRRLNRVHSSILFVQNTKMGRSA